MKTNLLDENMLKDVVQHMNEDHADACLAIVQNLGKLPLAKSAQMIGMDNMAAEFIAVMADNTQSTTRVSFDKPISNERQIRGHLVSMTKRARKLT